MIQKKSVVNKLSSIKQKCVKCQKEKKDSSFYLVYSDVYGNHSHICKQCANNLFCDYKEEYGVRNALILISSKLDIIVFDDVLEKWTIHSSTSKGESKISKQEFLDGYISDVFTKIELDDIDTSACSFEYSNFLNYPFSFISFHPDIDIIGDNIEVENIENACGLTKKEFRNLTLKWGDFEPSDLVWLENEYSEWNDQYELTDKSQSTIIKQVCLELFEIKEKRNQHLDASDNLKMVSSLLNTSKLSPKKITTSKGENNISSFSDLVAQLEERGPIKHSQHNEDVDKLHDLMVSMAGALARTARKNGPLTEAFEEIYSDYTVDISSIVSSPFDED